MRECVSKVIPSQWGFCFDGNQSEFCGRIESLLGRSSFDYLEIGLGHGVTLRSVSEFVEQFDTDWRLVGVDVVGYRGNAINPQEMGRHFGGVYQPQELDRQQARSIAVCLTGSEFFLSNCPRRFDFVFIDGCHGAPCVKRDFLLSEPLVNEGGIVCFHDTDTNCQDIHHQPHCGTGIRARQAVQELGLLDDKRHGWRKVAETGGNIGRGVHGCLFVQKV